MRLPSNLRVLEAHLHEAQDRSLTLEVSYGAIRPIN